jgi:hypothetical protein
LLLARLLLFLPLALLGFPALLLFYPGLLLGRQARLLFLPPPQFLLLLLQSQ